MTLPKITMQRVKDLIYFISILLAVVFYIRDKAVGRAVQEAQLKNMVENQENILNKLKEIDVKNEKQAEINGKILMYIELTSADN
jgi:hypothetical protein